MNLAELLNHEARALELEFDGATESDATYGAIRRRRVAWQGATAGVAVVGIGVVVVGSVKIGNWTQPATFPSPTAPPSGLAKIEWADASVLSDVAAGDVCGVAPPLPVLEAEGLRLEELAGEQGVRYTASMMSVGPSDVTVYSDSFEEIDGVTELVPAPTVDLARASAVPEWSADPAAGDYGDTAMFAVTSDREIAIHALVPTPTLFLVRDGVVVALQQSHKALFSPLGLGDAALSAADVGPSAFGTLCPGFSTGPDGLLPVGEYEVVAAVTVTASPQVAALYARYEPDGGLADMPRPLQPFGPGDWECEDPGMYPLAIECDPLASIDRQRGVVSLPYDATTYTADVRVTLVSERHRFSVLSDTNRYAPADQSTPFPDVPECAAQFDIDGVPDTLGMAIPLELLWTQPNRESFGVQLMAAEDVRQGQLSIPDPLEIWVTRVFEGNRAGLDTGLDQHEVIVGYGVIAIAGSPLTLNRADGPTITDATVTDLVWCDGVTPGDTNFGVETRVYVRGEAVWTDESGTTTRTLHGSVDHQSWS